MALHASSAENSHKKLQNVREHASRSQSIKQLDQHLLKISFRVRATKQESVEVRSLSKHDRIQWLVSKSKRIWIVHLKFRQLVDHVICVDAEKRMIYDNAEVYPFPLSVENLRRCGGPTAPEI